MNSDPKNVESIIHLPAVPIIETVDQGNQTYSGVFSILRKNDMITKKKNEFIEIQVATKFHKRQK